MSEEERAREMGWLQVSICMEERHQASAHVMCHI